VTHRTYLGHHFNVKIQNTIIRLFSTKNFYDCTVYTVYSSQVTTCADINNAYMAVSSALDKGCSVRALLIDFSKAFDRVKHNITRMHGSALRCVRSHSRSIWNMANLTPL